MTRMLGTSREPTLRGRDDQIGELRSAVDSAMSGRLSVVVIEGEAGIGKTRLLDQALQIAAESGCQVATAKAEEMEHGRPFGVIAAALGCARDAPDGRRATIANLISAHDSRDHGPLTVSSDPGLQFRVVDALCDLVESLAIGPTAGPRPRRPAVGRPVEPGHPGCPGPDRAGHAGGPDRVLPTLPTPARDAASVRVAGARRAPADRAAPARVTATCGTWSPRSSEPLRVPDCSGSSPVPRATRCS